MTHSACGPVAGDPYDRPGSPDRPRSPSPDHPRNRSRRNPNSPRRSGSTPPSPRRSSRNSEKQLFLPYGMLIQRKETQTLRRLQFHEKDRLEKMTKRFLSHHEKQQQMDTTPRCHGTSNIQTGVPEIGLLPTPTRNQASPPTNE